MAMQQFCMLLLAACPWHALPCARRSPAAMFDPRMPRCPCCNNILQAIYEWFDIGFDKFGRTPTRPQTQIGQVCWAVAGAAER